jgi:hypothetical protein
MYQLQEECITVATECIRAIPWPGSSLSVRVLRIKGRLWWVATDLCWALRTGLSANGRPNVTEALRSIDGADRTFAKLETAPGSLRPYTRYALVGAIGLRTLVERNRIEAGACAISDLSLHIWISRVVRDMMSCNDALTRLWPATQVIERPTESIGASAS